MKLALQAKPSALFNFYLFMYQEDGITDHVGKEMGRKRVTLLNVTWDIENDTCMIKEIYDEIMFWG